MEIGRSRYCIRASFSGVVLVIITVGLRSILNAGFCVGSSAGLSFGVNVNVNEDGVLWVLGRVRQVLLRHEQVTIGHQWT